MSDLETLWRQAAADPQHTPLFLQQLLNAEVYCLGKAQANGRIQFRMLETEDGEQAIAFFLNAAEIQQDLGAEAEFISLPARKLFEMTQGATLVLNPTSEASKEFSALEIDFLLQCAVSE